jgi:acyl dehydratase
MFSRASIHASDPFLLCMGLFSIFWLGAAQTLRPVRPGDTMQPTGIVKSKQATANSRWVLIDVTVHNQRDEKVATGEAMVEFPLS